MLKVLEIQKMDGYYWTSDRFKGNENLRGFKNLLSAVWFILNGRMGW
jgi:hypothetical protein